MSTPTLVRRLGGRATVLRAVRFGAVGASGVVVNQAAIVALLHLTTVHYLVAAVIATQVAIAWNFALSERWVFAGRGRHTAPQRRAAQFWAVNTASLAVHGPLMYALTEAAGLTPATSNLLVLGVLAVARFAVADRVIWTLRPALATADPAPGGHR